MNDNGDNLGEPIIGGLPIHNRNGVKRADTALRHADATDRENAIYGYFNETDVVRVLRRLQRIALNQKEKYEVGTQIEAAKVFLKYAMGQNAPPVVKIEAAHVEQRMTVIRIIAPGAEGGECRPST